MQRAQNGQTMIETMVAIFILVMGITAAVGLAVYAFGTSTNITKQIIATGLAREGVEAVKNMRDTNWLQQSTINTDCYNYLTGNNDGNCYRNWQTQYFDIKPDSTGSFLLRYDPSSAAFWNLTELNPIDGNRFGLNLNEDINSIGFGGFYYHPAGGIVDGNSNYYRKIVIQENSSQPYNSNIGPQLIVRSQVWWSDKKCPRVQNYDSANSGCRVEIQTFLTNWKNY